MYFGKIINTEDEWGFDVFQTTFESFIEVDDDTHIETIERANNEGKLIKGDKDGKPILVDQPEPTEKEKAEQRIGELESYLSETDWYAIRYADEGKEIPSNIKQKRHEAREKISRLRESFKE